MNVYNRSPKLFALSGFPKAFIVPQTSMMIMECSGTGVSDRQMMSFVRLFIRIDFSLQPYTGQQRLRPMGLWKGSDFCINLFITESSN